MLKVVAVITVSFLLVACGTFPQNDDEARAWFRSSSYALRSEYSVPSLSMASAAEKLQAFANKCLMKKITHTTKEAGEYPKTSSYSTTLKPRFIKDKNGTFTLIVQRDVKEMNYIGVPDSGRYDFMAQITPEKKGVHVFSSRIKQWGDLSFGNILQDLETWMKGADRFCPELG